MATGCVAERRHDVALPEARLRGGRPGGLRRVGAGRGGRVLHLDAEVGVGDRLVGDQLRGDRADGVRRDREADALVAARVGSGSAR